jgi:hypothetical protein
MFTLTTNISDRPRSLLVRGRRHRPLPGVCVHPGVDRRRSEEQRRRLNPPLAVGVAPLRTWQDDVDDDDDDDDDCIDLFSSCCISSLDALGTNMCELTERRRSVLLVGRSWLRNDGGGVGGGQRSRGEHRPDRESGKNGLGSRRTGRVDILGKQVNNENRNMTFSS